MFGTMTKFVRDSAVTPYEANRIKKDGGIVCFFHEKTISCSTIINVEQHVVRVMDKNGREMLVPYNSLRRPGRVDQPAAQGILDFLPPHSDEVQLAWSDDYAELLDKMITNATKEDATFPENGTDVAVIFNHMSRFNNNNEYTTGVFKSDYLVPAIDSFVKKHQPPFRAANIFAEAIPMPNEIDSQQSRLVGDYVYMWNKFTPVHWRHALVGNWMKNARKVTDDKVTDDKELRPPLVSVFDQIEDFTKDISLPFINGADTTMLELITSAKKKVPEDLLDPIFDAAMYVKENRKKDYLHIKKNMLEFGNEPYWEKLALETKGDDAKHALRNIMTESFNKERRKEIVDEMLGQPAASRKSLLDALDQWKSDVDCDAINMLAHDSKDEIAHRAISLLEERCPEQYIDFVKDAILKNGPTDSALLYQARKSYVTTLIGDITTLHQFTLDHGDKLDAFFQDIASSDNTVAKEGTIDALDPEGLYKNAPVLELLAGDDAMSPEYKEKARDLLGKVLQSSAGSTTD